MVTSTFPAFTPAARRSVQHFGLRFCVDSAVRTLIHTGEQYAEELKRRAIQ
jgi:hypothetical protein